MLFRSPQPRRINPPVWPLPRSLATTSGISVDFFSSPYLDVSVQAVPYVNLWIQLTLTEYCSAGFPHSEIFGSKPICGSPKLIAACRVLHRLSVPRHSPCALYSLTYYGRILQCLETRSFCPVPVILPHPPRQYTKYCTRRLRRLSKTFLKTSSSRSISESSVVLFHTTVLYCKN